MQAEDVQSVGVVGAGTMGAGIAQVCATAGLQAVLIDVGLDQLNRAMAAIQSSLAKLAQKGTLPGGDAQTVAGRIRTATDLDALKNVDVAIEAVFEDAAVKEDLLRKLDGACRGDAVLASNTSSISITRLAAATKRPSSSRACTS